MLAVAGLRNKSRGCCPSKGPLKPNTARIGTGGGEHCKTPNPTGWMKERCEVPSASACSASGCSQQVGNSGTKPPFAGGGGGRSLLPIFQACSSAAHLPSNLFIAQKPQGVPIKGQGWPHCHRGRAQRAPRTSTDTNKSQKRHHGPPALRSSSPCCPRRHPGVAQLISTINSAPRPRLLAWHRRGPRAQRERRCRPPAPPRCVGKGASRHPAGFSPDVH